MSPRAALLFALLPLLACDKGSGSGAAPVPPANPPPQASAPGSQPTAKAEGGSPIAGQILLADGVSADEVKPGDILFIMAREPGAGAGTVGRLVAVQRHADVKLPFAFSVAASDVMVPGLPFTGPFMVMARVDHDGDPMTKGEDDLYAFGEAPVMAGQADLKLVLKKGPPKDMPGVTPPGAPPGDAPAANPHGAMPGASPHGPMPATNNPHGAVPPGAPTAPRHP